jgi:hypothetical protein
MSRCEWKVLNLYLTQAVPYDDAKPGAAIAVHSFGDFQNFNPLLHVPATDGCFYNDTAFRVCPPPDTAELERLFRYEVFKMLKSEGKINELIIENMVNWRHSGFNVYCGKPIWPRNQQGLENLARYIIRASFSQERMAYVAAQDSSDGLAKVIYNSKMVKNLNRLTHWTGWHNSQPISTIRANRWFAIMDFTQISHVAYAKKPASMIKFQP